MKQWLAERSNRVYLYLVAVAIFGVLVTYNIVEQEDVQVWVNLVGNLLGISVGAVATANVNKAKHVAEDEEPWRLNGPVDPDEPF